MKSGIYGKMAVVIGILATAALMGTPARGQTVGTTTNGDVTAKGDLTVEGGDIKGSGGSAVLSWSSTQVDVKKDTLQVPTELYFQGSGTNSYRIKVEDFTWDSQVFQRLMIRPTVHNVQRAVAICDDGWSGDKGIIVKNQGCTGIGSINDLSTWTMTDLLYLSGAESIVFHEGGSKAMLFNAELDPLNDGGWFNRLSNNPARASAPAAGVQMEYLYGQLQLWAAPAGQTGSSISDVDRKGIVVHDDGNVGIGMGIYEAPVEALELNGAMLFHRWPDAQGPPSHSGTAAIWADSNGDLWARGDGDTGTQFSPHSDPRAIDQQAQTSFGDPTVKIPFSMRHQNPYLGKGEVIDMAKLVKWAEGKMKTDLGDKAGQLIFSYALPKEQCLNPTDYEVSAVMDELKKIPAIKVKVDEDGKIPPEALMEVDEMRSERKTVEVPEKSVDFEAGKIVTVMRKQEIQIQVATGRKIRRFRPGWTFSDGELYRRPTVDDLDLDAIARKHPGLPQWVKDRITAGGQGGQSLSGLAEEIKKRLAAAEPAAEKAVVLATSPESEGQ